VTRFRFQIVSVLAVFVALAVGLGVGTAALHGPAAANARERSDSTDRRNQQLLDQLAHLNADVSVREQFAESLAPVVLAGRLTGARVLVLSTESGRSDVDGVLAMLRVAGATVAARAELADTFTDPDNQEELLDLANRSLPPSVTAGLPPGVDGVTASAALLAAVLVARNPPVSDVDIRSVLAAYTSQGYLSTATAVTTPADAVVLVAGAPATGSDANSRNAALFSVVQQFDRAGSLVVADGADSGAGNIVAMVRADTALAQNVSTIDNVATPQGRLVAAWALADQLAGRTGHYGTGAGAMLLPAGTG
jgi:hypothetical protein